LTQVPRMYQEAFMTIERDNRFTSETPFRAMIGRTHEVKASNLDKHIGHCFIRIAQFRLPWHFYSIWLLLSLLLDLEIIGKR
jgi:hypothetical protein